MLKRSKNPARELAEIGADVVLTIVAFGLDAIAIAILGRRKSLRKKTR